MAFFNYSTMQMMAKIVYYGPGLGGKTTNLQYIYSQTASDSRGEMVSLETETDRTLFFDLLPIEVGLVSGFRTRIQLYTVPGQVFYNTTRKLVLKAVDGIVFVADSQRPMMDANLFSLRNLGDNLAELGLSVDDVPVVLQYNKRDLPDVCSVDEMNSLLNPHNRPHYEVSAITGEGVFETLQGITKFALIALKKQLEMKPPEEAPWANDKGAVAIPDIGTEPEPETEDDADTVVRGPESAPSLDEETAGSPTPDLVEIDVTPEDLPQATVSDSAAESRAIARRVVDRSVKLAVKPQYLERTRRLALSLHLEDERRRVVQMLPDLTVEIEQEEEADEILLRLNILLSSRK